MNALVGSSVVALATSLCLSGVALTPLASRPAVLRSAAPSVEGVQQTQTANSTLSTAVTAPTAAAKRQPRRVVLLNLVTKRCADIPFFEKGKINGPVSQFLCRPGPDDNQQFVLLPRGNHGTSERFMIQNYKDRLCLDVPGRGKVRKGTRVREFKCILDDNQIFYKWGFTNGRNWLVHEKTGMCLDVAGDRSNALGLDLLLWPCSAEDDHYWALPAPQNAPVDPL